VWDLLRPAAPGGIPGPGQVRRGAGGQPTTRLAAAAMTARA
jgi:hypothetical protein